ncbi:MAG: non-ribosomal peptide synthase/polyketide synthase [Bacteroidota bacterium]
MGSAQSPLHASQQDILIDQLLNTDSPHYNIGGYIILRGALNKAAFTETIASAPAIFDVFRMRFNTETTGLHLTYGEGYTPMDLPELDFSKEADPAATAIAWMQDRFKISFTISAESPLFEQYLVKISATEHWFYGRYHHLVTDGFGFLVWVQYISRKYRSLIENVVVEFSYPSYRESALQSAEYRASSAYEAEGAYWKSKIAEKPTALFHKKYHQPASVAPAILTLVISPEQKALLDNAKLLTGSGLQQMTLAALLVYFGKTTDLSTFVFGIPVHKRTSKKLRNTLGLFSGVLPHAATYDESLAIEEVLAHLNQNLRQDYRHLNYLNGDLSRQLKINPVEEFLTEVIVNYQPYNFELNFGENIDAKVEILSNEVGTNPLQFCWWEDERNGLLELKINYATAYFTAREIDLLVNRLLFIIGQFGNNLHNSVKKIEIVPVPEMTLLATFNQQKLLPGAAVNTIELFEAEVEKNPTASALYFENEVLNYEELNRRANQFANQLIALGLKQEGLVALCLERGVEMVVAILGVWKAGGAFVPIDPAYPTDRIEYMLEDSGAPFIITTSQLTSSFKANETATVIELDNQTEWQTQPGNDPGLSINSSQLAYIIYTSGSTGKPKGVMVEHGNLVNLLLSIASDIDFHQGNSFLSVTTYSFDICYLELLVPLTQGGKLFLVSRDTAVDGYRLQESIARFRPSHLQATPATWRMLLNVGWQNEDQTSLLVGGETVPEDLKETLVSLGTTWNVYGPTETTIWSTVKKLSSDEKVSIGKPIANNTVYVLDKRGNPCPIGVSGEICIGGVQVARGYFNRLNLTTEKFVPDPFMRIPGARMFRTGDIGMWQIDGNLACFGRVDDQVKIRGHRVELGEIETVLQQASFVKQAVVVAKEDKLDNKRLVAYIVADEGYDRSALLAHLAGKVPEYMIPALWMQLDTLPLTANGKINRKALPEPDASEAATSIYVAAHNETEQQLVEIWEQLLDVSPVGVEDNFFELGGDSLITIQLVSRARAIGIEFQPKDVFVCQTISRLAGIATGLTTSTPRKEEALLKRSFGLLPAQQRIVDQPTSDFSSNSQYVLLNVPKSVGHAQLSDIVAKVKGRHDALRSAFHAVKGQWEQEFTGNGIELQREQLSEKTADIHSSELTAIIEKYRSGLNIEKGNLTACVLLETAGAEDDRLLVLIHNLVIDQRSWQMLIDDFHSGTNDTVGGNGINSSHPEARSDYGQSLQALEKYAHHSRLQQELGYWEKLTLEYKSLTQSKSTKSAAKKTKHAQHRRLLPASDTHQLLNEAQRAYCTDSRTLLITALADTFRQLKGQETVFIGIYGDARPAFDNAAGMSRTVGNFGSVYPQPIVMPGITDQGDLIKTIKEQLLEVPANGIGYSVLRYTEKAAVLQGTDPWDILFQYEPQTFQSGVIGVKPGPAIPRPAEADAAPLALSCMFDGEQMSFTWDFNSAVYKEVAVKALATKFIECLHAALQHCMQDGRAINHTPSDFQLAGVATYKDLDAFLNEDVEGQLRGQAIDSIYRLTTLQQGMLFHGLYEGGVGTYINQFGCELVNADQGLLLESWNVVLKNHSVLRSAFYYERFTAPVQAVYKKVTLPLTLLDFSNLDSSAQQSAIAEFEKSERQKGFDFQAPPLMRLALIRLSAERTAMIWTAHHILFDGWSWPVVIEELLGNYDALVAGGKLSEVKEDRFEDFIRLVEKTDTSKQEQFWTAYLKGVEQPTLLPFIQSTLERTKGVGTYATKSFILDIDSTGLVRKFAQRHRLTLNTLMQGIWATILYRYTSNENVVYGLIESGRPEDLDQVERRVGMYINTLPFHTKVQRDKKLVPWLQQIQAQQVASRQYQHTALHDIQAWAGIQGDFFDSLLVFLNYPLAKVLRSREWKLQVEKVHNHEQNNFPLTVTVTNAETLGVAFTYNRDLLEDIYLEQLTKHFEQALRQLVADDTLSIADIELLSAAETDHLLHELNDTDTRIALTESVLDLFEHQVSAHPGATALVFEQQVLTYQELNQRSNQVAHYLRSLKVKEGHFVPLCFERGPEMIIAILGTLKAGAAYVPLDPAFPAERTRFMLQDIKARVLLTNSRNAPAFEDASKLTVIELDDTAGLLHLQPTTNTRIAIDPAQPAYVIYTSGSTGNPKGVVVRHSSLSNYILNGQTAYVGDDQTNSGSFIHLSYTFDASLTALFMPLVKGKQVVIASGQSLNVFDDINLWKYAPYDFIKLTPSHLELIQPKLTNGKGQLLTNKLVIGGEALRLSHVQQLVDGQLDISIINEYGPTEATVGCNTFIFNTGHLDEKMPAAIPIGKPIDHVLLYVLNRHNELMPLGTTGEICIGGAGLATGYLNQPGLTNEKFILDPFKKDGSRIYRTGDLGRWLPDGNMDYLGRIDDQVKIRGYRIELGEIENILEKSPEVAQAVALAVGLPGNERLVAYIVPAETFDREAIQEFLDQRLPVYMIPELLLELSTLPLTKNGKVDRKALAQNIANDFVSDNFIGARNETEEKLAIIWKNLLDIDDIGIADDFFDVGGHSLLAVRMIAAVRKEFGVELNINEVFDHPTIGKIARMIGNDDPGAQEAVITAQVRPEHIPLSFSQERLWFIDQLEGSQQYHVPAVLGLNGQLDVAALAAAMKAIVNRHEVLRTVIREHGGKGYQHILSADNWKLEEVDGSGFATGTALEDQIQRLITRPFDLTKDYMIRASLLRMNDVEHKLVVTMHHIASDAWSIAIIVKEIVELYSAFAARRAVDLPQPKLQYADFAIWQRATMQDSFLEQKAAYWKKKLDGVAALQLPTDFTRPAVRTGRGASAATFIEKDLADQLRSLAQSQGATLFMTLLATFKVLLHRYSGQSDISVGTSTGNRAQQELEALVGFFVNTLALRSEVKAGESFTDLLQQVKTTTLEAYTHLDLPFEKVVESVVKERDPSRSPLFQVMLVLLNTPEVAELKFGDVQLTNENFKSSRSLFDLTFFVNETAEGLALDVEYSADLYQASTIERMMEHFKRLLQAVVDNPREQIGLLPLLSTAETIQVTEGFNTSTASYPKDQTIVSLFEALVKKQPDNIALLFEDEKLSYAALNNRANKLAHLLKKKGVKENTLVPLCMDRSADMFVAILGILKAGAAYVPIDVDFPATRVRFMLEDIQASFILSNTRSWNTLEELTGGTLEIIEVDADAMSLAQQPTTNFREKPATNAGAYLIYTSGSTGQPKGVLIEHRNLVDYVYGLNKETGIETSRSFALVSTIATDLGNTVIFSSLLFGGALHIFSKDTVSSVDALHRYFRVHQIDCLKIVPSHWQALALDDKPLLPRKLLVFGGEALQAEAIEQIRVTGSACKVVNHYGPTETTIGKLLHPVHPGENYVGTVPVGRPFSNTTVYILSPALQPVPIGVPGELYIGGDGVAQGYLNQPALTGEKFVKNPFQSTTAPVLYRTGDLVKFLPGGNILFIGRVDDQVKIRGYRVELGEVASVLQQCAAVSQAVVIAKEDKQGNKKLVGYVVPVDEFDREVIVDFLQEKLPEYMIPSILVPLETLPLTANGKVDRKALPDADTAEPGKGQSVAPRNEIEQSLAAIWEDVLEVENIGVNDDFFELGGHSLLAIRLISAIRKTFKIEVPISDVFDYPTVATLAARFNQQPAEVTMPVIQAVKPRPEDIPLSFSQERLWFIDRLEGSVQYHVPAVLRLTGKLDIQAFSKSLETIINRHEVLRTVIYQKDGQPYQFIKEKSNWSLEVVDGAKYLDDQAGMQQQVEQLISRPFDLSKDLMLRATLFTFSEDNMLLVLTLHHIASDGWSKSVLVKELVEAYTSFIGKRTHNLPALPVQYADFSIWQRSFLEGPVLQEKLGYWKTKLSGVQPIQLPTDFKRPAVWSNRGANTSFNINRELSGDLLDLGQRQGVTLFMVLLSSFKVLLQRYSGQSDICVGTPVAGRMQQELEKLIGFFVNTLALRTEVDPGVSFEQLLQQVKETTMEAYAHQEVPFEKVVDSIAEQRDTSRNPLFQVMFILRNMPEIPELRFGEVLMSIEEYGHKTSMFDLALFITETPNGLDAVLEYNTDVYKEATILRLIGHYKKLLDSITRQPSLELGLLPILTDLEEHQLKLGFNDTTAPYSKEVTAILLFEEQAERKPLNPALVFHDQQLSYADLNEQANQLARYLQHKGIQREELVPVCIERGPLMIVAILGILKAGAAYVPIDPHYPLDRIQYMLQDSSATIVISDSESILKLPTITPVQVIELDADWPEISKQSTENLQLEIEPGQLAYIIYTSGSTGKPKGVMIEHGNLSAFIAWCRQEFAASPFDVVYATTSICFDLSVFEIFYPLSIGKKIRIIESGLFISDHLHADKNILINTVPTVMEHLLKEGGDLSGVNVINMAGEPIPSFVQQHLDTNKIEVRNLYGPSEDTTYSTIYRLQQDQPILIGKPISNTTVFIVGQKNELVPIGVPGEICISGAGLARGYLNMPELTATKFLVNPFDQSAASRMYRTGDLGRWLPDGNIEFLGRIDSQVKIRGFRIELGEIETALNELATVDNSCVLVRTDDNGKQLVSFYVPNSNKTRQIENELYKARVETWQEVYDTEYTEGEENVTSVDAEFNIVGWKDSFSGKPIPAADMREWLSDTTNRIFAVAPKNVLEIGTGTGLIYFQLAGKVGRYIGTDFSAASINQVKKRIAAGEKNYGDTSFKVAPAHEVELNAGEEIDTIVINSVAQYFPGEGYMTGVIDKCVSLLKGKGTIVIGDVRDLRLLELFKARLNLEKFQPSVSVKEFKWAVQQDVLKEEELCFSPGYFYSLHALVPGISHVDIQWKHASYENELSLYRYTVTLYVGEIPEVIIPGWQDFDTLAAIRKQLDQGVSMIALQDVQNPRLHIEEAITSALQDNTITTVADIKQVIDRQTRNNDLHQLLETAVDKGYGYRLYVDEDLFRWNVLLTSSSSNTLVAQPFKEKPAARACATNIPLFQDISTVLQKEIRLALEKRLPDYMIPASFFALDQLPLTSNGKIDRLFLGTRQSASLNLNLSYQPPVTGTEVTLVAIWQELLNISRIGIHDNFFEIGGHSLLGMRLISAVRRQMEVELNIKDLFSFPTVAALAAHISHMSKGLLLPSIDVQERPALIPLSFSQERLWFIDQLEGSLQYHISTVLRLEGQLDVNALSATFQTILNRHEVLRTVIRETEGKAYQYVANDEPFVIHRTNRAEMGAGETALQELIRALINKPFDLARDKMLRANLLEVANNEHIVIVTMHHIASDGWSASILVKEIIELYTAFVKGKPYLLAPLKVQYADYALWQRRYLQREVLAQKLAYWKQQLTGVVPLDLPLDYIRPLTKTNKGGYEEIKLDKILTSRLASISKEQDVTVFMTLAAALNVLLYKYSGQEDICIGTPVANRSHQEVENMIGFFINTLALRSSVQGAASFTDLVQQIKSTTLNAYTNQDVPFEMVVDAVVTERDISRTPLFQVLFVLQNTPEIPAFNIGDLKITKEQHDQSISKFDLTFSLTETAAGLQGYIQYSGDLFSASTIRRMTGHFKNLLHAIANEPTKKIDLLPLLTAGEQLQLLDSFSSSSVSFPQDKTIVDIFEAQAAANPNAIAVVFENQRLSYGALNAKANQLAHYLANTGIQREALVPICIERSLETLIAVLGVMKAGAAYVPIDPAFPADRINFILQDTGATIVLTTSRSRDRIVEPSGIEVLSLDQFQFEPKRSENLNRHIDTRNLVYVIYTSGSTGNPKGVMIEHRALLDHCYGVIESAGLHECASFALFAPLIFDAGHSLIHSSLILGASLNIISDERILDSGRLAEYLQLNPVDCLKIVPSLWMSYAEAGQVITAGKVMIFGGEPFNLNIQKLLRTRRYAGNILNHYGPTEATIGKCIHLVEPGKTYTTVPIGKPFSNTILYVVDAALQLLPIGVPGELLIGGEGIARAYLNNPVLSESRFVADPFRDEAGARVYRTGDLVRWLPDGNIEYIGRKDEQVKINGHRIEPGEIASIVLASGLVKDVAIVVREDNQGAKKLVAYVIAEGIFDKLLILPFLTAKLPDYMVPAAWVQVSSFPLTPNGKIDKRQLPAPEFIQPAVVGYIAPRNQAEKDLAQTWQDLLGLDRVGIEDNFFELGGDSILTIQVVSRAKRLGYNLVPKDLFIHQNIKLLAAAIADRSLGGVAGEQGTLTGESGLLPIQQWYFGKTGHNISHFNQAVLVGISKAVSIEVLESAVTQLLQYHDALRFRFFQRDRKWMQEYGGEAGKLSVENLATVPMEALSDFITRLAGVYQASLDIESGDLVKVVFIKTPAADTLNRIFIVIHHLAIDGVSWRILLEDLHRIIADKMEGKQTDLGLKSSSYRQWFEALKLHASSAALRAELPYWENVHHSFHPLPVDKERAGAVTVRDTRSLQVVLGKEQTLHLLKDVPGIYHTEINDILLAALAKSISAWSRQREIVIGMEGHGRENLADNTETLRTVGWFTTHYPVLLQAAAEANEGELIKTVKEQLRKVPGKGLGYGVLKYMAGVESLSGKQPWEIIFNYLGQFDNVVKENEWLKPVQESTGAAADQDYPVDALLSVNAAIRSGELALNWTYSNLQYQETTIRNLADNYVAALEGLIAHCLEQQTKGKVAYTPSDYGLGAEVSVKELEQFLEEEDDEEDNILSF